jgi:hypothetical protein
MEPAVVGHLEVSLLALEQPAVLQAQAALLLLNIKRFNYEICFSFT